MTPIFSHTEEWYTDAVESVRVVVEYYDTKTVTSMYRPTLIEMVDEDFVDCTGSLCYSTFPAATEWADTPYDVQVEYA